MNRIDRLFQDKPNQVLSVYFTAGYPELKDTLPVLQALQEAGVDMVELGFPFSDPLADGPVIQASSTQAIRNGMSVEVLFEQLRDMRNNIDMPVVLMGYLNPVMQYGEKRFFESCSEVGVDGLILPDLPADYFVENYAQLFEELNLHNILLISPETSEERMRQIDGISKGFVYMVSSNSITGANKDLVEQQSYFERVEAMGLKNPRLIGFGIKDHQTYSLACRHSAGAIVGSAFIKLLNEKGVDVDEIKKFVGDLRG